MDTKVSGLPVATTVGINDLLLLVQKISQSQYETRQISVDVFLKALTELVLPSADAPVDSADSPGARKVWTDGTNVYVALSDNLVKKFTLADV